MGSAMCILLAGDAFADNARSPYKANEADKPHIILVMADDQGWGDVGYNGHPFVKTPALDTMAGEGFVFDRFYAAAPVCSPTRAGVMTGRSSAHGRATIRTRSRLILASRLYVRAKPPDPRSNLSLPEKQGSNILSNNGLSNST